MSIHRTAGVINPDGTYSKGVHIIVVGQYNALTDTSLNVCQVFAVVERCLPVIAPSLDGDSFAYDDCMVLDGWEMNFLREGCGVSRGVAVWVEDFVTPAGTSRVFRV